MPHLLRIAALTLLTAFSAGTAAAQQTASSAKPVWVNLKSGVYHCPGTEHYGTTTNGEYLPEATAIGRGFSPNGGRRCSEAAASPSMDAAGAARPVPTLLPDSGPPMPTTGLSDCKVLVLKDGDTIQCQAQGAVRLIGIDTPERDQVPFGTAATAGMAALLPAGATVQLSPDKSQRDRYGRILAYAWYQGASVNWLMIRQGWAVSLRYPPDTGYADWFDRAEARAVAEQRGLWRVGGFSCRPSKHRAKLC
jgi:endonuclease YncB( thermonuclease family)